MSQLKLAASKIPIGLFEKLTQVTELTGLTQSAVVRNAIEYYLNNAEITKITALTPSEVKPSELVEMVNKVDKVNDRLSAIEARVSAIESRSVSTVKPIAAAIVAEPKPVPPPPPNGKPLADGGQWLSTSEAFEMARKRGCKHDKKTSFSKFAKAHPDRLDVWGLRYLGANKPGDQRTASFQDLRYLP